MEAVATPAPPGPNLMPAGTISVNFREFLADPHGTLRAARALGPLIAFRNQTFMAIRAKDVLPLFTDPRLRQMGTEGLEIQGIASGPFHRFARNTMLLANGPTHARRRRPAARSFHFSLMEALRPAIRAEAAAILAGLPREAPVDLRDAFAAELPARMIARILGLPQADIPRFTRLVYAMSPGLSLSVKPEDWPQVEAAAEELTAWVETLLAERRREPREDFLTAYLRLADETGDLSPDEVLIQIVTLVLAGADTTRAAMTIMVSLLLEHGVWGEVVRDAALVPGAVAESLRHEPSVASIVLIPMEDIAFAGCTLPAGRPLVVSMLSAMRDPALYGDPDRFDIRRTDHPRLHLVFGGGAHRCLGEALARAELEEGLNALRDAAPRLALAGRPARMAGVGGIRTVSRLGVLLGPG